MEKKRDIGIALMLLLLIGGALIGYFVLNGNFDKVQDLQTQKDININRNEKLEYYVGYWYESQEKAGLNSIVITNLEGSTFKMDLNFFGIKEFKNLTCRIDKDECEISFEEDTSSLKAKITLFDNQILLKITESTYEHIDLDALYKFNYFLTEEYVPSSEAIEKYTGETIDQKYIGTWYLSYLSDYSKNRFVISGYDGTNVNMYLTLNGIAFKGATATFEEGKGIVEFVSRETEKKVKAEITLSDTINIEVKESEVSEIEAKSYEFKVKPKSVSYDYYIARWYMTEDKDDENYIEIKYDEKGKVIFDLMIKRRAQIKNVSPNITKNIGTFECKSPSDERYLKGYITFDDDRIYIYFYDSTVESIKNGSTFEYVYKGVE